MWEPVWSETQAIGSFENRTGKMIVSDPCYKLETWCAEYIYNVAKGIWNAEVGITNEGSWGKRVAYLEAATQGSRGNWELINDDIGVDSGQMCISDHFEDFGIGEYNTKDTWYGKACEQTAEKYGGIVNHKDYEIAAVSSSGYGDGTYQLHGKKNSDGEYCAFRVVFIPKEEYE